MVATVTVTTLDELRNELRVMPERLFSSVKRETRVATLAVQSTVVGNISRGPLHSRTGALARSIQAEVAGDRLSTLRASVFSDKVPYARIQEEGGTIVAKKAYRRTPGGPYLNIPTRENKTASGVTRMTAQQVFAAKGYIRKSRLGNYLVFGTLKGRVVPLFSLKKSVTLPARLGMKDSANKEAAALLDRLRTVDII